MYKLVFCAFPYHFQSDSIYAHHTLVTPAENKVIFAHLKKSIQYLWVPSCRADPGFANGARQPIGPSLPKKSGHSATGSVLAGLESEAYALVRFVCRYLIDSRSCSFHSSVGTTQGVDVVRMWFAT